MTKGLQKSIAVLYDTFAKYQSMSTLEGSSIYEDLEEWKKELKSKNLKDLTATDLSRFAGKVILTWGDENDYKFYLPRILELSASYNNPYDIWTVYSRLENAKWKLWDSKEQEAINNFTFELWKHIVNDNRKEALYNFKEYFHAILCYYPNIQSIFISWETSKSTVAIKHLSNYILEERVHIFDKNYINSTIKNTVHIAAFKAWLTSDSIINKLENAFFDIKNKEIAAQLSWAEQIIRSEKNSC
jgi:hypothetical protein